MGTGMSVVLLALGAALVWGTPTDARGPSLTATGLALTALGVAGTVLSLAYRFRRWRRVGRERDERLFVDT